MAASPTFTHGSLQQELQAFREVLDIAREDLRKLLKCTRLPEDGIALITLKRRLTHLLVDCDRKLAVLSLS